MLFVGQVSGCGVSSTQLRPQMEVVGPCFTPVKHGWGLRLGHHTRSLMLVRVLSQVIIVLNMTMM